MFICFLFDCPLALSCLSLPLVCVRACTRAVRACRACVRACMRPGRCVGACDWRCAASPSLYTATAVCGGGAHPPLPSVVFACRRGACSLGSFFAFFLSGCSVFTTPVPCGVVAVRVADNVLFRWGDVSPLCTVHCVLCTVCAWCAVLRCLRCWCLGVSRLPSERPHLCTVCLHYLDTGCTALATIPMTAR